MNRFRVCSILTILLGMYGCASNDTVEIDLCPDNPEKAVPGVCGCASPDVDDDQNGVVDCLEKNIDMDNVDLCPDDDAKLTPGVCGCGVPDEDLNGDLLPDCLDLCPDDENKLTPGLCGCGIPDVDEDQSGVVDCLEKDLDLCPDNENKTLPGLCGCEDDTDLDENGIPKCLDLCPDNDNKTRPGYCGCDVEDTNELGFNFPDCIADAVDYCPDNDDLRFPDERCGCKGDTPENTADDDFDGVINCLDVCPQNPTKWEGENLDCETADSDGDGVDDEKDQCPNNPRIQDLGPDDNCFPYDPKTKTYTIEYASDFVALPEFYKNHMLPAVSCTGTVRICDEDNPNRALICTSGVLLPHTCETCTPSQDATNFSCAAGNTLTAVSDPHFTILLKEDINLADAIAPQYEDDGSCHAAWTSLDNLIRTKFDGNGKKIAFTSKLDGRRCSLDHSLFNHVTLSEISNLTVELDVAGPAQAILAGDVNSSKLEQVHVLGNLTSNSARCAQTGVGGVAGHVRSAISGIKSQIINSDAPHIRLLNINSVVAGGYYGYLSDVILKMDGDFYVDSVFSVGNTGGIWGQMIALDYKNVDLSKARFHVGSIDSNTRAGGLAYYININSTLKKDLESALAIDSLDIGQITAKISAAALVHTNYANLGDATVRLNTIRVPQLGGLVYDHFAALMKNIRFSANSLVADRIGGLTFMKRNNDVTTTFKDIAFDIEKILKENDSDDTGGILSYGLEAASDVSYENIAYHVAHAEMYEGAALVYSIDAPAVRFNRIVAQIDSFKVDELACGLICYLSNVDLDIREANIVLPGVEAYSVRPWFGSLGKIKRIAMTQVSMLANLHGVDPQAMIPGADALPEMSVQLKNSFFAMPIFIDKDKLFDKPMLLDADKLAILDPEALSSSRFFSLVEKPLLVPGDTALAEKLIVNEEKLGEAQKFLAENGDSDAGKWEMFSFTLNVKDGKKLKFPVFSPTGLKLPEISSASDK